MYCEMYLLNLVWKIKMGEICCEIEFPRLFGKINKERKKQL
jgi:hypothetical protein